MDSLVVLLLSRKLLFPYGAAQQPTTCLLSFWIHIIQSRNHSGAVWDQESWTHSVSTAINLSPFTSNFKFRFPCKDCLCKQICLCPSVYFFSPKAMVYYQKICTQNFWYRWLYKLNMSIRCLALDVMCVLHVVLPSRHTRHHKASEEPRCLNHFFQTSVHKIPVR